MTFAVDRRYKHAEDSVRPVWTNDARSMAADTAKTRWPKTVQNMVEDMDQSTREVAAMELEKKEEGLRIAEELKRISKEIQRNERLQ
jgi:hypothetical protein